MERKIEVVGLGVENETSTFLLKIPYESGTDFELTRSLSEVIHHHPWYQSRSSRVRLRAILRRMMLETAGRSAATLTQQFSNSSIEVEEDETISFLSHPIAESPDHLLAELELMRQEMEATQRETDIIGSRVDEGLSRLKEKVAAR